VITETDATTGRESPALSQADSPRRASFAFFRATPATLFMGGRSYRSY
jgi:hypothetical protein